MFISSPLFVVFHNNDVACYGFCTLAECGTFIRVQTSFRALLFGPVLILSNDIRKFRYYKYNLDYNQTKKELACTPIACMLSRLHISVLLLLFYFVFVNNVFHK
jgi:hypothetical protein